MKINNKIVYQSFKTFYPAYLAEHQNRTCRLLHFVGSCGVLVLLGIAALTQSWWLLCAVPLIGYGFAWVGHFIFEKNKPATFHHPFYSFLGDWVMFKDILLGKVRL